MRNYYRTLFHDINHSSQKTMDCVVLSRKGCNIPNFRPTIFKHERIDHDDYIDVLFSYWVEDPIAFEQDDLFCILGVSQLFMIYMYIYGLCWELTLKHMIDEMFCVGCGP